jgi:hypothetical protein
MNFGLAVLEFLAGYILIVSVLVWMASKILP